MDFNGQKKQDFGEMNKKQKLNKRMNRRRAHKKNTTHTEPERNHREMKGERRKENENMSIQCNRIVHL